MHDNDLTIHPILCPNDILTKINIALDTSSTDMCQMPAEDLVQAGREIWRLRQQYKFLMKRLNDAR